MNDAYIISKMNEYMFQLNGKMGIWLNKKLPQITDKWWQELVVNNLSPLQREHVKGGARLFEYVKRGDAFNEEKTKLEQIKNTLREEYNNLPETISRYAIDDGCGGLRDIQGVKYSSKAIYKKQDEIADLTLQPYIGRIDISDGGEKACVYYIGKAEDKKIGNIHGIRGVL